MMAMVISVNYKQFGFEITPPPAVRQGEMPWGQYTRPFAGFLNLESGSRLVTWITRYGICVLLLPDVCRT